jgi:hypothetical protein
VPEIRDVKIGSSVIVIVANGHALPVKESAKTSPFRHVGKGTVARMRQVMREFKRLSIAVCICNTAERTMSSRFRSSIPA